MKKQRSQCCWIFLSALELILAACTQAPSPQIDTGPLPTRAITLMPMLSPTATPTPWGGASAKLGPMPQDCPAGPAPQNLDPNVSSEYGGGSVWGSGFTGSHALLEWLPNEAVSTHDQNGWGHPMLWIVKSSIQGPIAIRGANLSNGLPLRPDAEAASPDSIPTVLILNPSNPDAQYQGQFIEFPGGIDIPKAGCYYLEADWPGGSWRITFAAGVVSSET
jgi:hypothetical protein